MLICLRSSCREDRSKRKDCCYRAFEIRILVCSSNRKSCIVVQWNKCQLKTTLCLCRRQTSSSKASTGNKNRLLDFDDAFIGREMVQAISNMHLWIYDSLKCLRKFRAVSYVLDDRLKSNEAFLVYYTLTISTGDDITLLGWGTQVHVLREVCQLAKDKLNVSCELIDLVTLLPWDKETLAQVRSLLFMPSASWSSRSILNESCGRTIAQNAISTAEWKVMNEPNHRAKLK